MMWNRGKTKAVMLAVGVCLVTGCAKDIEEEPSAAVLQPQSLADNAVSAAPAPTPSVEPPAEESPAPEPESDIVTITISAAGDVTLGTHQEQDYWNSFRQAYDQAEDESYFFANVYDIFSTDDMTLVNLEGPLTLAEEAREGQVYSIKGDPEYVDILTAGSVEAVSMGNNHTLDYQQQGREDTIRAVEDAGVVYACEKTVGICEVKGINIGMISVNEVSQGYLVEDTIQKGIAELQEQGADLILVSCHWGVEREYYPEDYQKILGEKCIDWGADLVIGHHPHVLQGIDEYKGRFILYSLGNFCFGANRNPPDKDTMIFQQTFTFIDGEKQEDREIRVIPCSVSSVPERNNFQPTPAEGEEKARILSRINEFSLEFGVQFDEDGYMQE
ncbi:MAG: CapA family protein [Eubacterium sp.]|nr:CapA family protein [Eubacterium sp.]MCM1214893.1 CapA family protein [Lachnospiraceae bacterium]MCM1303520.1 CapA family protein [Butyrivibrio sp.]MCM1342716.1 CapA family protein [Muribaculaceae bacterium]MCM1238969.1 CapA family protein [Lachnospiraceae bacterium]